jgi:hypothetical protein
LLDANRLKALRERLGEEFPGKTILDVSVRTGAGIKEWFASLDATAPGSGKAMDIDYDVYADGEALLGWMNATVNVRANEEFDANALLQMMASEMKNGLADAEIAHLKMTFSPDDSLAGEIAALSVVRSDIVPELNLKLDAPVHAGQLIVNCRAEGSPEVLRRALGDAVDAIQHAFPGLAGKIEHVEQFRPGRPTPTHRLQTPVAA